MVRGIAGTIAAFAVVIAPLAGIAYLMKNYSPWWGLLLPLYASIILTLMTMADID
jgi:hypothetical protein